MGCGFFRAVGVAVCALVISLAAIAQPSSTGSRFDITGYAVEGSPLLRSDDFSRIISPYIGKQKSAADVQNAQRALQQAYLDLGYCSVQVAVPKTDPDAGVITFRLVQTPTPVSKDCLPMVVLDDKRVSPSINIAPGEVAVRPLSDAAGVTSTAPSADAGAPSAAGSVRAATKPLLDRPVAAAASSPANPATMLAQNEEPASGVTVKPLAEPIAPPVAVAKPEVAVPIPARAEPAKPVVDPSPVVATGEEKVSAKPTPKPQVVEPKESVPLSVTKPEAQSVPEVAKTVITPPPPVTPPPSIQVAAAPKVESVAPNAEVKPPQSATPSDVTVRPLASAIAVAPEAATPQLAAPEPSRASARPLQDPPKSATAPEVKPAVIAEAVATKKSATKPAPVVVEAPPPTPVDPALAGAPVAASGLKFDVDRYVVEGNTLLKPAVIGRILRQYAGKQRDFTDVQRALEALQAAYQDTGYGAVQVTLPEQELERGEVRLDVVEPRLVKVEVQGNEHHTEKNVRNSQPELKEGATPNSLAIARTLRVANENPSKQTQVALRAGNQDGEIDATVKVVDENPVKYSIAADNTGTYATGKYRVGLGYQNANLFGRDHMLTLQYITSPDHPAMVTVLGLGYHVPLYNSGNSVDLIAGYSDVSSATVQQLFSVAGAGTVLGARYNHNFDRAGNLEHKITYGVDYKAFKSNVTFINSSAPLVPDITVHPVSVTYSGLWRGSVSQLDYYASYAQNLFPGGNDGANSDFQERKPGFVNPARTDAKAGYNVIRAGATYTHQFGGEFQARLAFSIQHTQNALISGEQFGAGGADSVRGFDERAYSNDRGYRTSFELYTPDMASNVGWSGGRVKFLFFYDTANLTRNSVQPAEAPGLSIDSLGFGLRLQTKNYFSLRVDYAQVLHDGGVNLQQGPGLHDGRRNSNTVHAQAVWLY
jgi:hemolysin activation/secretion protein